MFGNLAVPEKCYSITGMISGNVFSARGEKLRAKALIYTLNVAASSS